MKLFTTGIFLCILHHYTLAATDKIICYYESWHNTGYFTPDDIDVNICTHVNFAFLRPNADGDFRFDDAGGDESVLIQFGKLKTKNPDVKLIITVGGWTEDAVSFSEVAADPHRKATMASTVVQYMKTYNLDGIDIDWEFPEANDKQNFVDLLSVIRTNLDDNGGGIITVVVPANHDTNSYDMNSISKIVDAINVMTFDYHGNGDDETTGANSPLYASSSDSNQQLNCDASINSWLNAGADPSKLVLGVPFYGHEFLLSDPEEHTIGSPVTSSDSHYTSYYKICPLNDSWTEEWDDEQQVPYKYSDKQWYSYDNSKSVQIKVDYAKKRGLGGIMVYAINDEDKDGACGEIKPLLHAIKNNL